MPRKLKLNRETLRRLDPSHLAAARGAVKRSVEVPEIPTVDQLTCFHTCITVCMTCMLTVCDACDTLQGCGVIG